MQKGKTADKSEFIYGINSIESLFKVNAGNRKIKRLFISSDIRTDKRVESIKKKAEARGIVSDIIDNKDFKNIFKTCTEDVDISKKQNLLAEVSPYNYSDLDHFLRKDLKDNTVLVMLDGVTDVGNFGSILRNCSAFGADGVILSRHRSVTVSNRVSRISAGALEEVRLFLVKNLNSTIKVLKEKGLWVYGSSLKKEIARPIIEVDFNKPLVLVMGSEQKGITRLVEKNCDVLVRIPQSGKMQSLNVSVASGILLFSIQNVIRP